MVDKETRRLRDVRPLVLTYEGWVASMREIIAKRKEHAERRKEAIKQIHDLGVKKAALQEKLDDAFYAAYELPPGDAWLGDHLLAVHQIREELEATELALVKTRAADDLEQQTIELLKKLVMTTPPPNRKGLVESADGQQTPGDPSHPTKQPA